MENEKTMLIKIDGDLQEKYKSLCKNFGYNMSQRIRNFIDDEVKTMEKINNKETNLNLELEEFVKTTTMLKYKTPFIYGGIKDSFNGFIYDITLIDENGNIFTDRDYRRIVDMEYNRGLQLIAKKYNANIGFPKEYKLI